MLINLLFCLINQQALANVVEYMFYLNSRVITFCLHLQYCRLLCILLFYHLILVFCEYVDKACLATAPIWIYLFKLLLYIVRYKIKISRDMLLCLANIYTLNITDKLIRFIHNCASSTNGSIRGQWPFVADPRKYRMKKKKTYNVWGQKLSIL